MGPLPLLTATARCPHAARGRLETPILPTTIVLVAMSGSQRVNPVCAKRSHRQYIGHRQYQTGIVEGTLRAPLPLYARSYVQHGTRIYIPGIYLHGPLQTVFAQAHMTIIPGIPGGTGFLKQDGGSYTRRYRSPKTIRVAAQDGMHCVPQHGTKYTRRRGFTRKGGRKANGRSAACLHTHRTLLLLSVPNPLAFHLKKTTIQAASILESVKNVSVSNALQRPLDQPLLKAQRVAQQDEKIILQKIFCPETFCEIISSTSIHATIIYCHVYLKVLCCNHQQKNCGGSGGKGERPSKAPPSPYRPGIVGMRGSMVI